MRRGGACVPARTSAQRRFHTKNTHIMCGELNDGCALAGRHGRAHRHRPYQTPSYFSTQPTQTKEPFTHNPPKRNRRGGACVPARTSAQRRFHTQMNEYNYTTHRGRKCIAHSRPHSLKQVVYANWHRDDAPVVLKQAISLV